MTEVTSHYPIISQVVDLIEVLSYSREGKVTPVDMDN